MKNRNDKKEIELPVELVVNMLNEEEGAFDDILQFYDGYIKNAAKLSFTEEPDEDLIQEINIHHYYLQLIPFLYFILVL